VRIFTVPFYLHFDIAAQSVIKESSRQARLCEFDNIFSLPHASSFSVIEATPVPDGALVLRFFFFRLRSMVFKKTLSGPTLQCEPRLSRYLHIRGAEGGEKTQVSASWPPEPLLLLFYF
jgi:hypothetical protein